MNSDEPQDNLAPESTAETGMNDAPIPMPPDVREFVINKLAEILVLDYRQTHGLADPKD